MSRDNNTTIKGERNMSNNMEKILAKVIYYTAVLITFFACIGFVSSFVFMVEAWEITIFPFTIFACSISWIVSMVGFVYGLEL